MIVACEKPLGCAVVRARSAEDISRKGIVFMSEGRDEHNATIRGV